MDNFGTPLESLAAVAAATNAMATDASTNIPTPDNKNIDNAVADNPTTKTNNSSKTKKNQNKQYSEE